MQGWWYHCLPTRVWGLPSYPLIKDSIGVGASHWRLCSFALFCLVTPCPAMVSSSAAAAATAS